jgi:hypothetical protein
MTASQIHAPKFHKGQIVRYKREYVSKIKKQHDEMRANGHPPVGPHPFGNLIIYEAPQPNHSASTYMYYYEYNWGGTSEGAALEEDLESVAEGSRLV